MSGSGFNPDFVYDEDDERVWREELDEFIPERIFDFHGHTYLRSHLPADGLGQPESPSNPKVVDDYPHEAFADVEARIWPGRKVRALLFGSVAAGVDHDSTNAYAADAARRRGWEALLVPRIDDDVDAILGKVREGGFIGLKPYYTFVEGKASSEVTLEDMVTQAMREAADRAGLVMTVHIPRPGRLADPVNIDGLRRLCAEAPRAKIVLAHFGRTYFPEAVGAGYSLSDLPNLYPELSMVQDWEVIEGVFRSFDRRKVLFALDLPVAQEKGKCIGVNAQRHFFTRRPHSWSIHAEPGAYEVRCTLMAYEMVRAIRKAAERAKLDRGEIDGLFWRNAEEIVSSVRGGTQA